MYYFHFCAEIQGTGSQSGVTVNNSAVANRPRDAQCRWKFCYHSKYSTPFKFTLLSNKLCKFLLSSIVVMAISCVVSEIKRDIGRKSRFLYTNLYT